MSEPAAERADRVLQDDFEALQPSAPERRVTLGEGDDRIVLVQRQLSFFGKLELFSVLGKIIERALEAGGATIEDLFKIGKDVAAATENVTGRVLAAERSEDEEKAHEAQQIIVALARVVGIVPDALLELYCVALSVPRSRRVEIKEKLETSLSDEEGFAIAETFVDQNWSALVDFFTKRLAPLVEKFSERAGSASEEPRPSNPSARPTGNE